MSELESFLLKERLIAFFLDNPCHFPTAES